MTPEQSTLAGYARGAFRPLTALNSDHDPKLRRSQNAPEQSRPADAVGPGVASSDPALCGDRSLGGR